MYRGLVKPRTMLMIGLRLNVGGDPLGDMVLQVSNVGLNGEGKFMFEITGESCEDDDKFFILKRD